MINKDILMKMVIEFQRESCATMKEAQFKNDQSLVSECVGQSYAFSKVLSILDSINDV